MDSTHQIPEKENWRTPESSWRRFQSREQRAPQTARPNLRRMEVDWRTGGSQPEAGPAGRLDDSLTCGETLEEEMGKEGARIWLPHLNTRQAVAGDTELMHSMLDSLREMERERGFRMQEGSAQKNCPDHLYFRKLLVEWIIDVCADFKLCMGTAALAVAYNDHVLSAVMAVPPTSLQLVAMACILVAGE